MVKLQIMSDLHLEVGPQYHIFDVPVCAPYLILAGDIGRLQDYEPYLSFLDTQCKNFQKVFLVLGNHEFYGLTWTQAQDRATQMTREPRLSGRLTLLNCNKVELSDEVVILGCTLWSHIRPESVEFVQTKVKDFSRIEEWSVELHNVHHHHDYHWLRDNLNRMIENPVVGKQQSTGKRVVVVTHHAPIREGSSRPEHLQNPWTDAFATELLQQDPTDFINAIELTNPLASVDWWIFGHTHYTTECQRGQVRLISNQRGYVFPWQTVTTAQANAEQPGKCKAAEAKAQWKYLKLDRLSRYFTSGESLGGKRNQSRTDLLIADTKKGGHNFDVCRVIKVY